MLERYKKEWFSNVRGDILSGLVVAIALIPEAIGFSIIAGVNPMVGLYASFCIAITIAFVGGRPGMISAATGAMALVFAGLVKSHGVEYMLLATLLAGVIQIILGFLKIGNLLKFIPKPVMLGFVNALAIMIFKAQIQYFNGESIIMYLLVLLGLLIIYLLPKFTDKVPSALVSIVVVTSIAIFFKIDTSRIGDMGAVTGALPSFALPNAPFSLETFKIILPYSISMAFVGLIETLLTSRTIDEMTDTTSNKNKECVGQGISNIVSGLFGGMAGCAMIGQSVINVKSGGRGRLSTFVAGVGLMVLILILSTFVSLIPVAALVSVMFMVSISTFNFASIKRINKVPKSDAIVMIVTVIAVLLTDNLAIGVVIGIVLSSVFFVHKISNVNVEEIEEENYITYKCNGELFFASTTHFISKFNYKTDKKLVQLDCSNMRIWDESAVSAIDSVIIKMNENNVQVKLIGVSDKCNNLLEKISTYEKIINSKEILA